MLAQQYRFHGHGSLRYVYKNGQALRGKYMTIKSLPNPRRSRPRVAVVVSKKVLKSAVGRNQIRRRLYEAMRMLDLSKFIACDIAIIVTSSELRTLPQPELEELVSNFALEANLYKTNQ